MVKKSRTGKKKRSIYQKTAKQRAEEQNIPTEEDRTFEKKRLKITGIAMALLLMAIIFLMLAPRFTEMGVPYVTATLTAYAITAISGILMLYSLRYARKNQTSGRISGYLMLFIGASGFVYTIIHILQS